MATGVRCFRSKFGVPSREHPSADRPEARARARALVHAARNGMSNAVGVRLPSAAAAATAPQPAPTEEALLLGDARGRAKARPLRLRDALPSPSVRDTLIDGAKNSSNEFCSLALASAHSVGYLGAFDY